jgi:hypothetical protein
MRFSSVLLLVLCQTPALSSQSVSKSMVSDAAHCVVHGDHNWLEEGLQQNVIIVSATLDKTSYPKQTHLILLVHSANRTGQAFDIQVGKTADKRLYTIQNNAGFKMVGSHVSFTSPPLGGEWTQDHLARSIAKAMRSPLHTLSISSLTNGSSDLECSSYVSAKP